MKDNFRLAAKAFIVENGKLFMMKRRANDPHKPGAWDIPGGRLEPGESPFEGVKREAVEEIGCNIEVVMPIDVQHFTRDDDQRITLIMFVCKLVDKEIKLSPEHQEYTWLDLENDLIQIPDFFQRAITNFKQLK